MYSLGIILFEMWHPPFSTGMERINTIVALRERLVRAVGCATASSAALRLACCGVGDRVKT